MLPLIVILWFFSGAPVRLYPNNITGPTMFPLVPLADGDNNDTDLHIKTYRNILHMTTLLLHYGYCYSAKL